MALTLSVNPTKQEEKMADKNTSSLHAEISIDEKQYQTWETSALDSYYEFLGVDIAYPIGHPKYGKEGWGWKATTNICGEQI